MPRITKRTVDAAHPAESRYVLWDDRITGFGLLVLPSGVKSFVYDYRSPAGRKRRATIGKFGDWTPDEARERADQWRQGLREGIDPLDEKADRQNAPTVGDVLDAYLRSDKFAEKAESTRSIDRGRIERHLRPLLGRKIAHALTETEIKRAVASIRDGKTAGRIVTGKYGLARVTGGDGTARMALRLLRAIFAWAVREKLVPTNPVDGITTGADGERNIILDDAGAYERLFATLDRMERERRLRSPVADAIRIIALTGARRGEIAGARWRHVDLKAGTITLPIGEHKTGHRTQKPRVIALPAVAREIVARQPAGEPDDFVFARARGEDRSSGALNLSKPWRAIRTEARLPAGIGLHGLRHSLASLLAMGGAQAAEIMAALGHRDYATSQRYVHWAEQARSTLAERAAAPALAGMAAAAGKPAANVVPMKKGTGS